MITREGLYATSDTLGEMGDAIEDFLTDAGYSQLQASSAANKIVLHISDNLGGCQNYMPKECEDAPKATSFLHELTGVIAQALLTIHCFSAQAEIISPEITEHLRRVFKGNNFYIPNGAARNSFDRNARIFSDYKQGMTHRELARKYGNSIQWIYQIIAAERKKNKECRDMKQGQI